MVSNQHCPCQHYETFTTFRNVESPTSGAFNAKLKEMLAVIW